LDCAESAVKLQSIYQFSYLSRLTLTSVGFQFTSCSASYSVVIGVRYVCAYCMALTEAAGIVFEICEAIQFLHSHDIAHRDLKV